MSPRNFVAHPLHTSTPVLHRTNIRAFVDESASKLEQYQRLLSNAGTSPASDAASELLQIEQMAKCKSTENENESLRRHLYDVKSNLSDEINRNAGLTAENDALKTNIAKMNNLYQTSKLDHESTVQNLLREHQQQTADLSGRIEDLTGQAGHLVQSLQNKQDLVERLTELLHTEQQNSKRLADRLGEAQKELEQEIRRHEQTSALAEELRRELHEFREVRQNGVPEGKVGSMLYCETDLCEIVNYRLTHKVRFHFTVFSLVSARCVHFA